MYLALFLFPWMLMYALSTLAMNHRAFLVGDDDRPVPFERERQLTYDGTFPENAELRTISAQILTSVGLDGAHSVKRQSDGAIVINRQDLLTPRRVTYSPAARTVVIEKLQRRPTALLERFHRRRGYATGYVLDTVWAISVDLALVAMMVWVLSGLWMWWEMKVTRRAGGLALLGGASLFAFYLLTL
jgi:hypothetical protein